MGAGSIDFRGVKCLPTETNPALEGARNRWMGANREPEPTVAALVKQDGMIV